MRVLRPIALVCTVALSTSLPAAPAGAVAPVPAAVVALPPALDVAAFYEKQTVCDPTPKPGATALANLLVTTYGPATIYIPRTCSGSTSEHFDGRAVDWMRNSRVPAEKEMADTFVRWLLAPAADGTPHAMARRLGIMYIIWNNQMIRMYDPGRGWTDYRGCMDPANQGQSLDTSCHRNHVHLSTSWDGAAGFTSWWTGAAVTQPYCPTRASSATPGAGAPTLVADLAATPGLIPIPATPILDTAAGVGAGLTVGCRILAGRSLFPMALVPGTESAGYRWAAVTLTSTSNAPGQLLAWSSGSARPAGQIGTPIGTSSATILLPIASDGTIALSPTLGAANVSAQVVGYLVGDPAAPAPRVAPAPAPTAAGTPVARPSKPRAVRATSARRSVTTRWKAPASTGGSELVAYRVEALASAKKGARVAGTCMTAPATRACTIKGLKKGKRYWMSVSVANAAGSTWARRRPVRVR